MLQVRRGQQNLRRAVILLYGVQGPEPCAVQAVAPGEHGLLSEGPEAGFVLTAETAVQGHRRGGALILHGAFAPRFKGRAQNAAQKAGVLLAPSPLDGPRGVSRAAHNGDAS